MSYISYLNPANIKPIGRNVLIRRFPANEQVGLIHTPENRIERNLKCLVVAIPKGRWFDGKGYVAPEFKVGDTVLIRQWLGIELSPHDPSVAFIPEELVEAILTDEDATK